MLTATIKRRRYGLRFDPTWPHISLGLSAHVWPPKFAHLSLHLPVGVAVIGHVGADSDSAMGVEA